MKIVKFKWETKNIYSYTFNSFNDDIRDTDVYIDYLNENYKKFDFTKVDKFYNYICTIIDDMDYLFVEELENTKELDLYLNNLNYVYYDKILLEDKSKDFDTNYIFEIKDKKAKDFIKDKIKFKLSNKDKEPILVNSNNKYILNEIGRKEYEYVNYGFLKDDYLEIVLHQENGYIDDYR